jgi:transposase
MINFISIAIDVSKLSLDICVLPINKSFHISDTSTSIDKFISTLKSDYPDISIILIEHTDAYHSLILSCLIKNNFPVFLIEPRKARHFANASSKSAKTDKIDAFVLADFGIRFKPQPSNLKNIQLQELTARRRQLVDMLTQEKNRLEKAANDLIISKISTSISFIQASLLEIENEIDSFIDSAPTLKSKKKS